VIVVSITSNIANMVREVGNTLYIVHGTLYGTMYV